MLAPFCIMARAWPIKTAASAAIKRPQLGHPKQLLRQSTVKLYKTRVLRQRPKCWHHTVTNRRWHRTATTPSTQTDRSQFQPVISGGRGQQIRSEIIGKYKKIILEFRAQSSKLLAASGGVRMVDTLLELVTCFHVYRPRSCFSQSNSLSLFILLSGYKPSTPARHMPPNIDSIFYGTLYPQ